MHNYDKLKIVFYNNKNTVIFQNFLKNFCMEKKAFMKKKASRSPPPPFSVHFLTVPPTVHHSGGTVIQIQIDEGNKVFLNNDTRLAKLA